MGLWGLLIKPIMNIYIKILFKSKKKRIFVWPGRPEFAVWLVYTEYSTVNKVNEYYSDPDIPTKMFRIRFWPNSYPGLCTSNEGRLLEY